MASNDLPPGFKLDDDAGLPPGFTLDAQSPPQAKSPGLLESVIEPFKRVGTGIAQTALSVPQGYKAMYDLASRPQDVMDTIQNPSIIGNAAVETGKQIAPAIPSVVGGAVGSLAGPGGMVTGAMAGQGLYEAGKQLVTGKPQSPNESLTNIATAGLGTATGQAIPKGLEFLKKAPGKYLSLPEERHATAASMMSKIPERFGVDDAAVNQLYSTAEQLAVQPTVGMAPLTNLQNAMNRMGTQISQNPIPAITGSQLPKQMGKMQTQIGNVSGGVNAQQMDSIIKAINRNLNDQASPDRGMWKQMLSAVHKDVEAAAASTGDPAFRAYAEAIKAARTNFLKKDIEEAINVSGIKEQRTGASTIAAPGSVERWMRLNPEWAANVEKVHPGLIASIKQDLQEVVPIADYVGRSIPGQRFGSGRLVMGGAVGHLLSQKLGLPPGTAESLGAILGGILPSTGFKMSPEYIRSSFSPNTAVPSKLGGILGAGGFK